MTPLSRGIISSGKLDEGGGPVEATYSMFDFNGTSDYITIADAANLSPAGNNFTFIQWVNVVSFATNPNPTLIAKWSSTNGQKEYLIRLGAGAIIFDYTTTGSTASGVQLFINTTINVSTLYQVAIRRNGADLDFFLNGVQVGVSQNISTDTIFNSTHPTEIGAANTHSSEFLEGSTSYPIQLNTNLSDGQILEQYNVGKPFAYSVQPTYITSNDVLALELTSNDATANDLSGNNNDGTISGATATGENITFDLVGP